MVESYMNEPDLKDYPVFVAHGHYMNGLANKFGVSRLRVIDVFWFDPLLEQPTSTRLAACEHMEDSAGKWRAILEIKKKRKAANELRRQKTELKMIATRKVDEDVAVANLEAKEEAKHVTPEVEDSAEEELDVDVTTTNLLRH